MILVTGGTGLLGGHLLYALLQCYERVAVLKRLSGNTDTLKEIFSFYSKNPDELLGRIDWRVGDLLDKQSLVGAMADISCVINCAAVVSFQANDRKLLVANNVLGTKNLAEAWKGLGVKGHRESRLLIHISSISALGDGPGNDPGFLIDEQTPRNTRRVHSGYSISKFESEKALTEIVPDAVILNPGVILGPGQWGKGSSLLFVKVWNGIKYYPYGGTGFVDVRDVAGIIIGIIDRMHLNKDREIATGIQGLDHDGLGMNGERYCIVGANLRYRDFFNLVTDEYGIPNPGIYAGKVLTALAWRADGLWSAMVGRSPLLTRETAEASQRISFYSSLKIQQALDYQFRPVGETIDWVAGFYIKMLN
jgi:nucleoside-diphosphate-sugar epimerase